MKKTNQSGFSVVEALLILVVIGILGFIGWFVYNRQHKPVQSATSDTSSVVSSQTKQSASPAPAYTTATLNGLTARVVTLPVKKSDPAPLGQNSAITASGRYIAEDTNGMQTTANEGGKLIYDGKTVYDGAYLFDYGLSQNGLHYIYVLDTNTSHRGGKFEVYVDGKLKQTYDDTQNDVTNLAVSNDGSHYAYLLGNYGTSLVKDGKSIYTSSSNMIADFSADLSKYIVATGVNTDFYDLLVNGQQVASHVAFMGTSMPNIGISANGQHYVYTDGKAVYEDGKSVASGKGVAAMVVTDSGSYAVADPLSNKLSTNATTHTLPAKFAEGCNPGCLYNPPLQLAADNAGAHYIFGTQSLPLWYVDDKQVTAPGDIQSVEFVNDTPYIYVWQS